MKNMEKNISERYLNSNQFDKDIIRQQSYKIFKKEPYLKSSNSKKNNSIQYNKYKLNTDFNNDNYNDEEINLNININNYLSKNNLYTNSNSRNNYLPMSGNRKNSEKSKILLKKNNTERYKTQMISDRNKIIKNNSSNKNNNIYNKKKSYNNLNSQLLVNINQQKNDLNNFDNNNINNDIIINGKEEPKNVPKILTFLRTFKNLSLPIKPNNDKKQSENSCNKDIKDTYNNYEEHNDNNYSTNQNNSCVNFNSKFKPKIRKINLSERNKVNCDNNINNKFINDENDKCDKNEGEDLIDFNRFTFRNNNIDEDNSPFKTFNNIKSNNKNILFNPRDINLYDYNKKKDDHESDSEDNHNIDKFLKRNNNNINTSISNNYKQKKENIRKRYMKKIYSKNENIKYNNNNQNKRINHISPEFDQGKNIRNNLFYKSYNNNDEYKEKLSKFKPELKNNIVYNYDIASKNIYKIQSVDKKYNNKNEESIKSLNMSKRYKKPILNNIFYKKNNKLNKGNNSYSKKNININEINYSKSNDHYSSNKFFKNNTNNKLAININDSIESHYDSHYFNTNNNFISNRNPLKIKIYNLNNNNNQYSEISPLTSKQINYEGSDSDNIETSRIEDEEDINDNDYDNDYDKLYYNKKNTIYSRFMKPFERNEKKWYRKDSFFSFDIDEMKKFSKNRNLSFYNKLKNKTKQMNKNNSMYIKRVVHYNNKRNSFINENNENDLNELNNSKNKNVYNFEEKEYNINDFDAPKAIKETTEDYNNSELINDSSKENQFSINSDLNTNKLNDSSSNQIDSDNYNCDNKKYNQTISNNNAQKYVYMKKLNTVYNFYKGTKKLISNINNKVFNLKKKDNIKNEKNYNNLDKIENNNNNKNKINKNYYNFVQQNNLLIYQGELTPRMNNDENEENSSSYYTKNSGTTSLMEDNYAKNIKNNNIIIIIKIINKKNSLIKKFYNYFLPKINYKSNNNFFIKRHYVINYQVYKIPINPIYYMTKNNLKIYKIPLIKKCHFQKYHLINDKSNEIQKLYSFFTLGENYTQKLNNSEFSNKIENDNNKILNLKNNINIKDKQTNLLISNDFNDIQKIDVHFSNSISFGCHKNILNSNSIDNSNNKIEINNFNFTLFPKIIPTFKDKENNNKQKEENIIINNNKLNKSRIYKYDYDQILSLRNNIFCTNNNLLSKKVLNHFENLNNETDSFIISFKQNYKENKIPHKKKLKKDEIQNLIKTYLIQNKNEDLKKLIHINLLKENNENMDINNNDKNDNIDNNIEDNNNDNNKNNEVKFEWVRNDFSKEIEQAENYIKELRKKIQENTKRNEYIFLLNMLTVDNLNTILNKIQNLITKNNEEEFLLDKDIIYNKYILIKVILEKAIMEKRFVNLYAKLCYELFYKLNDIIYNNINFKKILMEECRIKFIELNNIDKNYNN